MKKALSLFSIIFLALFLIACGDQETSKESDNEGKTEEVNNTGSAEKQAEYMEEIDKQSEDDDTYEGELGTYSELGKYGDEEIKVDFEGFNLTIEPTLVEIQLNEEAQLEEELKGKDKIRAIYLKTTGENTNDHDVDYNGTMTIVTSEKEQLNTDSGIMSENPIVQTYMGKVKEEGAFTVPLKDVSSEPESIELVLDPPYKVEDGAVDPVNGVMGEEEKIELELYK